MLAHKAVNKCPVLNALIMKVLAPSAFKDVPRASRAGHVRAFHLVTASYVKREMGNVISLLSKVASRLLCFLSVRDFLPQFSPCGEIIRRRHRNNPSAAGELPCHCLSSRSPPWLSSSAQHLSSAPRLGCPSRASRWVGDSKFRVALNSQGFQWDFGAWEELRSCLRTLQIRPFNAVNLLTLEGSSLEGGADADGRGLLGAGPRWGGEAAAQRTREIGIWHQQSQFQRHLPGACFLRHRLWLGKASDSPTFNFLFY